MNLCNHIFKSWVIKTDNSCKLPFLQQQYIQVLNDMTVPGNLSVLPFAAPTHEPPVLRPETLKKCSQHSCTDTSAHQCFSLSKGPSFLSCEAFLKVGHRGWSPHNWAGQGGVQSCQYWLSGLLSSKTPVREQYF